MDNFEFIKSKLERFIRKFYVNELIKGAILFFAIGVLYFLVTLLIENFLWLNRLGRTILFWLFIGVEAGLFIRFILIPLARLLKLTKGISYHGASKIIGSHFSEVNDRLLNLLQLSENEASSSLLLASIDQKSEELQPIPFRLAVNFKNNFKYLKYAAIPVIIIAASFVFSKTNWISKSYQRVINYEVAYEPPAPFQFYIVNQELSTYENKDFILRVKTTGELIPENAMIEYNEEVYFLKNVGVGEFEHTMIQPKESLDFVISSNKVSSKVYTLSVTPIPALIDFEMQLDYPQYTGKKDELVKSSGNATVPEGTKVKWVVHTRNTNKVDWRIKDTVISMVKNNGDFSLIKKVNSSLDYEISTSNSKVENYDVLAFNLAVIKDQYPELNIKSRKDTLDSQTMYFLGRVSDDYGLRDLSLVYYNQDTPLKKNVFPIPVKREVFDEFIYVFPNDMELIEGVDYEFYFVVRDNDVLHNYKSTKSQVFNFRKLTDKEQEDKRLKEQNSAISGLSKALDKFKKQENDLKSLSKLQKEKSQLDFNDKKKLDEYLKRQKTQEKMMKNFSKKLKENLKKTEKKDEPFKDALRERLERNEERLKKNEKLLEELEKLADKIDKEELTEKLEELAKENKNSKKNLEQLLELTKRFYVIEKHEKLASKLEDLAEKQEELSDKKEEDNTKEKQEELNEEFEDFQKEMKELRDQNEKLKKPMKLDQKKEDEENIKQEQEKASENLEKNSKSEAKKNQKSAAQKMKQMSKGMQMQMQSAGKEQQMEDMEMLRQILDNLVDFSLEQEGLMKQFRGMDVDNPVYSKKLKRQSVLRESFIHIDDSLYALALRTPQITETVTQKLTDIEFNIDKSLEKLAENQVSQGVSSQRYTITGSNDLAYLLSSVLNQMQNSSSSSGKGKSGPNEFQLPDIIKKQGELSDKMKEGMKKGEKKGGGKEGEKEGDKGNKEGGEKKGKSGKGGKNGNEKGSDKNGKSENGNGNSDEQQEDIDGELYEIYKQQQQLRNALADKIKKEGIGNGAGSSLLKRMEQVEQELLEKGFNENTLSKMLNLKHELLKLEEATFEQGEEERRESQTNKNQFSNDRRNEMERAKQYFNTTEILNRQVLPLRQNYKKKVQEYFKKGND